MNNAQNLFSQSASHQNKQTEKKLQGEKWKRCYHVVPNELSSILNNYEYKVFSTINSFPDAHKQIGKQFSIRYFEHYGVKRSMANKCLNALVEKNLIKKVCNALGRFGSFYKVNISVDGQGWRYLDEKTVELRQDYNATSACDHVVVNKININFKDNINTLNSNKNNSLSNTGYSLEISNRLPYTDNAQSPTCAKKETVVCDEQKQKTLADELQGLVLEFKNLSPIQENEEMQDSDYGFNRFIELEKTVIKPLVSKTESESCQELWKSEIGPIEKRRDDKYCKYYERNLARAIKIYSLQTVLMAIRNRSRDLKLNGDMIKKKWTFWEFIAKLSYETDECNESILRYVNVHYRAMRKKENETMEEFVGRIKQEEVENARGKGTVNNTRNKKLFNNASRKQEL